MRPLRARRPEAGRLPPAAPAAAHLPTALSRWQPSAAPCQQRITSALARLPATVVGVRGSVQPAAAGILAGRAPPAPSVENAPVAQHQQHPDAPIPPAI